MRQSVGSIAGCLHLAVVRPLLQAYFSSALTRWCQHTYGKGASASGDKQASRTSLAAVGNTNALFPSVLVQIATPGVVLVTVGLVLWDAAAWGRNAEPEEALHEDDASLFRFSLVHLVRPPRGLVQTAASAFGLAALLTHALCGAGLLAVARLGIVE